MSGGFVVLRRSGGVWALPDGAVLAIGRRGAGLRLETTGRALLADEVIALAQPFAVRRTGGVLAALWRQPCAGVAVFAGTPVVVIDPLAPPQALLEEGESDHAH